MAGEQMTSRTTRRAFQALLATSAILLATLASSRPAQAFGHTNAYDYTTSSGFSYGSQVRWTIATMADDPQDMMRGGYAAHVMWVSTNGSTFEGGASWVEMGVTAGFEQQQGLFYYAAQGINWPANYSEVNLNDLPIPPCPPQGCTNAPLPSFGENHLFSILNSHGSDVYAVGLDNVFYWSWSGHSPPSPSFGIGMETTCNGCSGTYICPTTVSSPQWEDANFNFYNVDNGQFKINGLSGVSQSWSSYPTDFVDSFAC